MTAASADLPFDTPDLFPNALQLVKPGLAACLANFRHLVIDLQDHIALAIDKGLHLQLAARWRSRGGNFWRFSSYLGMRRMTGTSRNVSSYNKQQMEYQKPLPVR